ncbi:gem-like protein 6 [Phtheirospermum japonicum]|uniref:Gem-like protein 6 n=1 Tax=Phtheirospermum japonicum TaxID=374723 RepID=A0A830DNG2_9LAMI|nr:gem-like protein 6 [Phtheirospermum japonicum]
MELNHNRSRIGKKNVHKERVIGIPISSAEYAFSLERSQKSLLPDSTDAQYQLMPSPSKHYSKIRYTGRVDSVIAKMIKFGENVDTFAQGLREHVRLGPKFSETVKGKLSLGTRILQIGGVEKVFRHKFNIKDDEKLLKASQCYLSTTTGPIAGLLFISNNRIAFCSERSIKVTSPSGKLLKVHYKVMIPLGKIKSATESENAKKTTQKYVQIVTEDNFEFWFMGFLNHRRTLKSLQQALEFLII